jgi:hypothetical protein
MVGLEATLHYYWFGEELERISLTWYRGLQATSTDTPKLLQVVEADLTGPERIVVNEFGRS